MDPHGSGLLSLSSEIIEKILVHCRPRDVATFSQICRDAHTLVYHSTDQYLWRELFLSYPFDDPRRTHEGFCDSPSFDWKGELQRRICAEQIARSPHSSPDKQTEALGTFLSVVRTASPIARGDERIPSSSLLWVVDILQSTNLLRSPTFSHHNGSQTLARLRSYLALTLDDCGEEDTEGTARMKSLFAKCRCYVYDMRNYCKENDWGPLTQAGDANWVHVESIVNVILSNQAELPSEYADIRPPCGLEATRAYSAPGAATRATRDWAGIEGNWRRYVSFMDARDLLAFNTITSNPYLNHGSFFETVRFGDSTLLIELELHLIEPDSIPSQYNLDKFPVSDDPRYPNLHFVGSASNVQGNETKVIGSVHMSPEGTVRWRFASTYERHVQWSSEGVQIGGIASAAGVVGAWTGARHEPMDPLGPFWLWKTNPS